MDLMMAPNMSAAAGDPAAGAHAARPDPADRAPHPEHQRGSRASYALNSLLIFISSTERNSILRACFTILLMSSLCDFTYTTVMLTTDLHFEIFNGQFIYVLSSPLYRQLPAQWSYFGLILFMVVMYNAMFVMPTVFYFRYCLVVKRKELKMRQLFAVFAVPLSVSCFLGTLLALAVLTEHRVESCDQLLSHPLWTHSGYTTHNCIICNTSNKYFMPYVIAASIANTVMYGMMIYFAIAIFSTVRESTRRIQVQMNRLLVAQLLLPIFFACMPLSLFVICAFLRINVAGLTFLICLFIDWIPLVNQLIIIIMVSNYRRRAWYTIREPFCMLYVGRPFKIISVIETFHQTTNA